MTLLKVADGMIPVMNFKFTIIDNLMLIRIGRCI